MNSLRARSVPAQLMVGTRARSASGGGDERVVAHRRTRDQQHALIDELAECSLDRERGAHRQTQAGGVHELDLPIEPTALDEIVDGEPHERLGVTSECGAFFHRVRHVVEDADADRDGHASANPS